MQQQPVQPNADVVIIGGGIAGVTTAYFLAKRGVSVALVEKSEIGFEQSSRNQGFARQQGRHPLEIPLMMACNKMWQGFEKELNADLEWQQGGNMRLARDQQELARLEGICKAEADLGLGVRMVSPAEIKKLIPGLDVEGNFIGGMYCQSDGQAEPTKVPAAFARAAQEYGAKIYTRCPVERIEVAGGKVVGVDTLRGGIKAPVVVCAAGAWSSRLARTIGLGFPQRMIRSTCSESVEVPFISKTVMWGGGFIFRQRPNGMVWFSGGSNRGADYDITLESLRNMWMFMPNYVKNRRAIELHIGGPLLADIWRNMPWSDYRKHPFRYAVMWEPKPNLKKAELSRRAVAKHFTALKDIRIGRTWAGGIDATPDAIPVLGEADTVKGFLFATGFSGHGFGIGPMAGKMTAELITDGKPSMDISGFRFSRFKEGKLAMSMTQV
ncbi:MAG: FAD-binding oxidoreductase [Chloroflexi bacterium]|nr:FAD-binding oxidoreductase [Chloroflexota bacterium]